MENSNSFEMYKFARTLYAGSYASTEVWSYEKRSIVLKKLKKEKGVSKGAKKHAKREIKALNKVGIYVCCSFFNN
jgi:hypothetical protein